MKSQRLFILICLLLSSLCVLGQSAGYIPKITNSSGSISNSQIYQETNGNPVVLNPRIGISTTSPSTLLHINQDPAVLGAFNNSSILRITNNYLQIESGLATLSSPSTIRSTMDFEIRKGSSASPVSYIGQIGLESGATLGLFFKVAGVEGIRILESGNVGIGTSNPGSRIDVNSTNETIAKFSNSYAEIEFGSSGYDSRSNARIRNVKANKGLEISTNNKASQIYLSPNGRVGIGTNNPKAILDISNTHDNTVPFLKFTDASDTVVITKSGRIGIGTQSPTAKLEVRGKNPDDILIASFSNAANTSNLEIITEDSATIIRNSGSFDASIIVETGVAYKLLDPICGVNWGLYKFDSGRLAMGVAKPKSMLHLYSVSCEHDPLYETNIHHSIARFESFNTEIEINSENNDYGKIRNLRKDKGLELSTNNNDGQLYLNPNGSVGVGTIKTFDYKLAVNGTIGCKEVIIESDSNWPDYVFDENYKLMSLHELESYIKEHKHLPNIISAEEVKENGINVGNLGHSLLEKLEELTLHVIRQQKHIEAQQKTIEELQNKIK
jgi:hypothetical protein